MKISKLLWIVLLILSLSLVACSSDDGEGVTISEPEPTDVVNTQEKSEENTPEKEEPVEPTELEPTEPEPTEPEPTEEISSEQEETTESSEVVESKGLFDTEELINNLDDYVLRGADMPNEYRLLADGEQHITNLRVINSVGEIEGKKYIAATDRLDGWSLELERVKKDDFSPYTVFSRIEVFETSEGAQTALGPEWYSAYTNEDREANWIENGCDFGDECLMYYYEKIDPETELVTWQYEIAFVDSNVIGQVMGRGLDFDMDPDYILQIADILYEKIDDAQRLE